MRLKPSLLTSAKDEDGVINYAVDYDKDPWSWN
jgi:hypothetical protein